MKRLLLGVSLFSLSAQLWAQQGTTGLNGLEFVAPMQVAVGNDSNFLVDRTDPNQKLFVLSLSPSLQPGAPDIKPKLVNDQFLLLRLPKLGFHADSRRHEFVASWVPEFEIFKNNHDQNGMSQQAFASFNYYLRRNIQIFVSDSFMTSRDPTRTLSNAFVLLPRANYRENVLNGTIEFQPNALTNVAVQYDKAYSKFGQTDPLQIRLLDTNSSGYAVTVARMLGRKQRISGRYSLFTVRPVNSQRKLDDAVDTHRSFEDPISAFSMNYNFGPNPSTVIGLSGGLLKQKDASFTIGGSFQKRIGTFWPIIGYTRGIAFQNRSTNGLPQALDSGSFYEAITFRLQGQPSRRTAVLVDTTFARAVPGPLVESRKGLMGRFRFDYRLNDRNVLFTRWETYQQTKNALVQNAFSRNRFMVGIEISLAGEFERRTSRLNEDAQYVALTEHGIRRRPTQGN
jgi:hypothetical protein